MIIPNEGGSDLVGTADVIVVGGGSAGAVLAARLSQDPARPVLWSPWASKSSLTCPSANGCRTSLVTATPTRWPPATWT